MILHSPAYDRLPCTASASLPERGGNLARRNSSPPGHSLFLPYWQQFRLRYRRAATPAFVERVRQAYLTLLEQSVRRDLQCLRTEQAKGNGDADIESLVLEAQDLLARIKSRTAA